MASEFAQIIGPLAKSLLGEPTQATAVELRYGARGSLSIDLAKGTWFDHEANEGGGALDLVTRETHLLGKDRLDWLKNHGFEFETGHTNGNGGTAAPHQQRSPVATYDYTDEDGTLLMQVCRYDPKDFRQRRKPRADDPPDTIKGGWVWTVKDVKHVPYRLPQLIDNDGRVVCIVEGEKDVDRLLALGIPATTNLGGAGKWEDELNEYFRGADVVIIPDYDPQKLHPKTKKPMFHPDGRPVLPGQDHARVIAKTLRGTASRVRVLELWKHWKDMPLKGDVSDWIRHGGTVETLYALIDDTPNWRDDAVKTVPLIYPFPIVGKDIPRRQWIVPGLLLRRNVSILVAPPGSGKSLLTLQIALMNGTGLPWGGWNPRAPVKSLVINSEDDNDEMRRRLFAACEVMKIKEPQLGDRVAVAEAPGTIVIAKADARTKTVIAEPMLDRLTKTVLDNKIDVLVVDPFAETFIGDENSNSELKWAAVLWRQLARDTNAAVLLVHHTRKFNAEAGDMDSARGGGSLVGVARIVSTLFQMTPEEAAVYGVSEEERHQYLRFDDAKANLTLVTFKARWFEKETVTLPNDGEHGELPDEVGVLKPWRAKTLLARTSNDKINAILDDIAKGITSDDGVDLYSKTTAGGGKRWAGEVVIKHLNCAPKAAQQLIDECLIGGVLEEVSTVTSTSKGKKRNGLRVNNSQRPGTLIMEESL